MKTFIFYFLMLAAVGGTQAQTTKWTIDNTHAKIGFKVTHFGISETEGKFSAFNGRVLSDKPDFSDAKIEFTIDVVSIDTDNEQRDNHLRSPDFFDAPKYPSIVFKSKSLKAVGNNKYLITGDLTMHGITKELQLDVNYRGTVPQDPFGNTKAGFKITGSIDRTNWGLNWNGKLASGDALVSNDVVLECNVELIKAK